MCRSKNDPDGPSTCASETRAPFAASGATEDSLDTQIAVAESKLAATTGDTQTIPLPANPAITLPAPQTSDDPAVYVDPYPTMKGSDQVKVLCNECSGTGIYNGPTGFHTADPYQKNHTIPGHFACGGKGYRSILVSSARSRVRAHAKANQEAAEYRKKRLDAAAQKAVDDEKAKAAAAKKEAERRATLVQGFVGNEGDKIGGLTGTVIASKSFESRYGYHRTLRRFLSIQLDDGRVVTTSGSGKTLFDAANRQKVTIMSGQVSGRNNFRGQDQTELKMVKLKAH